MEKQILPRKEFTLIAGINGAGKTTFYEKNQLSPEAPFLRNSLRVNADEILVDLGLDWRSESAQFQAGKIAARKLNEYMAGNENFHQETTLSGNAHTHMKRLKAARANGFYVRLVYISLENVELAKRRIAARVKKGGHGIPDKVVEKRYIQSFGNIKYILQFCDEIQVFDNSLNGLRLILAKNGSFKVNNLKDFTYIEKYFR